MSKTAFITGASRGIGRGIALRLAKEGYDIGFTYHTKEEEAKSLSQAIHKLDQRCFYYQASLEEKDIAEVVTNKAINDLGHLDVLICNAGVTKLSKITEIDPELIDFLYNLNYRSYLTSTKVAANHMIENDIKGRIIYISSTRGFRAYRNDTVYGSLKAALNRAVESLAIELAEHEITINSVAPGATEVRKETSEKALKEGYLSSLVPLKRKGSPEDVANLVAFLVSNKASYITGETIKIDGGLILYGPNENPKGGLF